MPGIDLSVMVHLLNIDLKFKLVKQKYQAFNAEHYIAINAKVEKLLKANFISEY